MLEPLHIEPTEDHPRVELDAQKNIFELTGRSLPEDAASFYSPVVDWMKTYLENPNDQTIFTVKLEYFNSSSANRIMRIFIMMEEAYHSGTDIKIVWHFHKNDALLHDRGKEIKEIIDIPFILEEYEN